MAKAYLTHTHTWTQRHKCPLNPLPDPCPSRPICAPALALRPGSRLPDSPPLPGASATFGGPSLRPALLASSADLSHLGGRKGCGHGHMFRWWPLRWWRGVFPGARETELLSPSSRSFPSSAPRTLGTRRPGPPPPHLASQHSHKPPWASPRAQAPRSAGAYPLELTSLGT